MYILRSESMCWRFLYDETKADINRKWNGGNALY